MNTSPSSFQSRYGPWALVAGASKGLGAEFARQLAEKGLNLVLVARRQERLQALAADLQSHYPVQVQTIVCDLSQTDAATQIIEQTAGLEIGLLVYNAALAPVASFYSLSLEEHLRALNTNMRTPLELVYQLGSAMRSRKCGGILLMSSLSALQGSALITHYAATKAYNLNLAEGLWDELGQDGVSVLACMPASVDTAERPAGESGSNQPAGGMNPQQVAREALAALGRQSVIIPGAANRLAAFFIRHLMPRQSAVKMMGGVLKRMKN